MVDRLPTAAEVWEKIPVPTMTKEVIKTEKAGLHVFRLLRMHGIFGEFYGVECRDILGFATKFTDKYTRLGIESEGVAKELYSQGKTAARKEYRRLEGKMNERM